MIIPEDLTKRAPTLEGLGGKAWRFEPEWTKEAPAAVSTWLVNCPKAHPFWQWWILTVVHLRDLPGQPPAKKGYPEAQYEFIVLAMDPKCGNPPKEPYQYLSPTDVSVFFHGLKDEEVGALTEHAVKLIVNGWLSPDQDFRSAWRTMLPVMATSIAKGEKPPEPKDMPALTQKADGREAPYFTCPMCHQPDCDGSIHGDLQT